MDTNETTNTTNMGDMGGGTPPPPATGPSKNTVMGVLAYIGILVIVPYITAKDDPFVKFHIKQGLVLLVIEAAVWILSSMFFSLWPLWRLVNLITVIFSIIGIVYVVQGKEKELPFIGKFSKHFPI